MGIEPEKFWKERRINDLYSAVGRYCLSGLETHPSIKVWLKEIKKLEKEIESMENE